MDNHIQDVLLQRQNFNTEKLNEDDVKNILMQYEDDKKHLLQLRTEEKVRREKELAQKLANRQRRSLSDTDDDRNDVSFVKL